MARGARGTCPPPKKNRGKSIFLAIIVAFFGQSHVKFGNIVNFSGKCHKNSGISIIFRARIM